MPIINKILIIIFIFISITPTTATAKKLEKEYQKEWCEKHNGQTEFVLPDKTRCDCLTTKNAIEFDFGKKWAEAIGQSLYYSLQTGKRAGIVLILETPKDRKFWLRLNTTIDNFKLPIDTWQAGAVSSEKF
jgi:hypothetical protein